MTEKNVQYYTNGCREVHWELPTSALTNTLPIVDPLKNDLANKLDTILEMRQDYEETKRKMSNLEIQLKDAETAFNRQLSPEKGTILKVANRSYCCLQGQYQKPIVIEAVE